MKENKQGSLASGGVSSQKEGRLSLRVGEHRFKAEGPVAWVEAMVGQWAQILAIQAMQQGGIQSPLQASGAKPDAEAQVEATTPEGGLEEDDGGFRRVSPNFRPKLNLDLAAFVQLKEARLPQDLLLAAAYYHERYLGLEQYTPGQLNEALANLPQWNCSDASELLELAAMRGWVERMEDGRWTLTHTGLDHVHHDMAYEHDPD